MTVLKDIKSVAVIGAGPVGVAFAKALIKEKRFDHIQVFERSSNFGGLWNYTKPLFKNNPQTSLPSIPSVSPNVREERQVYKGRVSFQTPAYKYLTTNTPKNFIEYNGYSFPADTPLFPTRQHVFEYMVQFANTIDSYVNFNSELVSLQFLDDAKQYELHIKDSVKSTSSIYHFDAVVLAVGFHNIPYVPNIEGVSEWNDRFPGSISHSKDFDQPQDFLDSHGNILVIGNSASGVDVAYELATCLNRPIYKSKRSEPQLPGATDPNIKDFPNVKKFDPANKTVEFVDGQKLSNVEKVIFCTGYLKSMSFLPQPTESHGHGNQILSRLISNGSRVENLYNHMLPIGLPSLAIAGLPKYVLPVRLAESQAAWITRIWSGRIPVPSESIQRKYDLWCAENNGEGTNYHVLSFPKDVQYCMRLNKDVRHAGYGGYFGVEWRGNDIKLRSAMKAVKISYFKYQQNTGKCATSLKELEDSGYFEWPADAISCVQVPTFAP
ncbi:HBR032Cp [Eremothecium sinecaudum]|uniref:HBR032Cp n=1 Tax=Eremothecium sinecaudum TaxID=45286 RepID=A0A109UWN2_9SACH|nr:HBR032Cp [Eremothecium sinecaudum]AMD18933.1 HBR032Cp [Eremothecium sinecaudum]